MASDHDSQEESVGLEVPGKWFGADLHVHSPASRDFVSTTSGTQEERVDRLYFALLDQAHQEGVSIIAITDHNEIEGYAKLVELAEDLRRTERIFAGTNASLPDEVKHLLDLFSQVIVLPGAEVDTKFGMHCLVVFDPRKPIQEMDSFLERAGYPKTRRNQESASQYAEWDLQETCREADKFGAIAIAAHVDSSSGLYELTKHSPGHVRIAAFRDPNLHVMEFVNPVARDQIENYFKQPEYDRQAPMAFIQSSDFHGASDHQIGSRRTWVRLDNVRWEAAEVFGALKEALLNPDEFVSAPGRPEVQAIMRRLDDRPAVRCLDSDHETSQLAQYVCAFANSEDGTVVIVLRAELVGAVRLE